MCMGEKTRCCNTIIDKIFYRLFRDFLWKTLEGNVLSKEHVSISAMLRKKEQQHNFKNPLCYKIRIVFQLMPSKQKFKPTDSYSRFHVIQEM